jgi:hypothetical protein
MVSSGITFIQSFVKLKFEMDTHEIGEAAHLMNLLSYIRRKVSYKEREAFFY